MTASDHLNPQQFFHGTVAEDLDEVTPRGEGRYFRSDHEGTHAFATTDVDDAWHYAEKAWHHASSGVPRVYQVEPLGDVEKDPHEQNYSGKWHRSKTGFGVVGEVPMPEHMGPQEDWR
jgi:hypothetical protein